MRELLEHMAEQEEQHLQYFEEQIAERRVRPTLLHPVWHAAGFALGAVTARMGTRAAMACTVAVEEVISDHYGEQIEKLGDDEKELKKKIAQFKAEEEEHHDIGIENDAEQTPGYEVLSGLIKAGSRAAIWIAKRI